MSNELKYPYPPDTKHGKGSRMQATVSIDHWVRLKRIRPQKKYNEIVLCTLFHRLMSECEKQQINDYSHLDRFHALITGITFPDTRNGLLGGGAVTESLPGEALPRPDTRTAASASPTLEGLQVNVGDEGGVTKGTGQHHQPLEKSGEAAKGRRKGKAVVGK